MKKHEALNIFKILEIAYPQHYRNMGKEKAEAMVDLWTELFADDNAEQVAAAVKSFIVADERGYPPHIGAIKAELRINQVPKNGTPHPDGGVWWNNQQMPGVLPTCS